MWHKSWWLCVSLRNMVCCFIRHYKGYVYFKYNGFPFRCNIICYLWHIQNLILYKTVKAEKFKSQINLLENKIILNETGHKPCFFIKKQKTPLTTIHMYGIIYIVRDLPIYSQKGKCTMRKSKWFRFVFEDGFCCICRGFSKIEMAVIVKEHGKLVSKILEN